jgi:RNA polymerase sigma-70 factor, ECF subfamily
LNAVWIDGRAGHADKVRRAALLSARDDTFCRRTEAMTVTFGADIVHKLPQLRRFARRLGGDRSIADDLVQETVLRALAHADQFRPGTNLMAWLTTILSNCYYDEKRRARWIAPVTVDHLVSPPVVAPQQEWQFFMSEVGSRLASLPATQREALVLVGANGLSYEHGGRVAGCPSGTMKSRVSRARYNLRRLLERDDTPSGCRGAPRPRREHPAAAAQCTV